MQIRKHGAQIAQRKLNKRSIERRMPSIAPPGAPRAQPEKNDGECMDELTLGLIGAGAVVVGGVVVYNAWQGAKVRRKMPRPMPDEAAESLARNDADEEHPFIEPTRPVRREPAMGEGDTSRTRGSSRVSAVRRSPRWRRPIPQSISRLNRPR
jgi:hypothetical protein